MKYDKVELVRAINEKLPDLQAKDVELALHSIVEQLTNAITQGERIEIRGFGSFDVRRREPRIGRNPKTGAAVNVPAKTVIHFKPGKAMRERVNAARDQSA